MVRWARWGRWSAFEAELTYEGEFTGDRPNRTSVTTLKGNFMLAPKISIGSRTGSWASALSGREPKPLRPENSTSWTAVLY